MKITLYLSVLLLNVAVAGDIPRTTSPEQAEVYIVSPVNGETVRSPVRVVFGLRNMGVAPAGVIFPGSGHHHLLVDTGLPDLKQPIPADEHHLHFGKGQTETMLELEPGRHTLQLLIGDALHMPHLPPVVSKKILIVVERPVKEQEETDALPDEEQATSSRDNIPTATTDSET